MKGRLGQILEACLATPQEGAKLASQVDESIKLEMGREMKNRFLFGKEDSGSTTEEDLAGYILQINLTV